MSTPARAILIDMDGVLYLGERAIPGVHQTLDWLREKSVPHLFLTNTTSRPRSALVEKLGRMGIETQAEHILTPPVAANNWLKSHVDGPVALFVPPATLTEFNNLTSVTEESTSPVSAVVIGDYGSHWTYAQLNQAFRWLMQDPPPAFIALGMTRYWRAEDGLRLDTAPFVKALEHASGQQALVLGKPAAPFFETALKLVGATAEESRMIGDDIRSDIEGAQTHGIGGLLVKTGKFRPEDLKLDIQPLSILESIADLPDWWRGQANKTDSSEES